MRTLLFAAVAAVALCACQGNSIDQNEVAARTARLYYESLVQGRYADFVDGFYRPDSIPESYHSQLVDNARMFMAQQNDEHGGIRRIDAAGAKADTTRRYADAFLLLTFADSTREEVAVPMVWVNGVWMMKQ